MRKITYAFGVLAGLVLSFVLFIHTAQAATFTVTTTGDESAVDPNIGCDIGDGECTLRSTIETANAQAGDDTIEFNIPGGGVQTITPTTDLPLIEDVTGSATIIDGSTQSGASCGTLVPSLPATSNTPHTLLIEINGSNIVGPLLALSSNNPGATVRGLVLNNAINSVVQVYNGTFTVECNYIGTNPAGDTAVGSSGANGIAGGAIIQNNLISGLNIAVAASGGAIQQNLIGTTSNGLSALPNGAGVYTDNNTIQENVISGSTGDGIFINFASNNLENPSPIIIGNFIGLNLAGQPLGNGGDGIHSEASSSNWFYAYRIGGTAASEGNVISANVGNGISISSQDGGGGCSSNTNSWIFNNKIGTTDTGGVSGGYGNSGSGISINETNGSCGGSVYKHQIGGDETGQANVIAGNAEDGIRVYQYIQDADIHADVFSVSILPNSIYGNGNLGINLATDTINSGEANVDLDPNVLNDYLLNYPASYANNYLNRPTVNSAAYSGNQLTVNYDFQAPPGVTPSEDGVSLLSADLVGYRLDFYINNAGQDGAYEGYNQGKTHLGSFMVDGSESSANHVFTSPVSLTAGQSISATATVLWTNSPGPATTPRECDGQTARTGDGPPYDYEGDCPN